MISVELSVLATNDSFKLLNPFLYPFVFRPMGVVPITVLLQFGAIYCISFLRILPDTSPNINVILTETPTKQSPV